MDYPRRIDQVAHKLRFLSGDHSKTGKRSDRYQMPTTAELCNS